MEEFTCKGSLILGSGCGRCTRCVKEINIEEKIEQLYWEFDARVKGYAKWKETPQTDRDAFKSVMRTAVYSVNKP